MPWPNSHRLMAGIIFFTLSCKQQTNLLLVYRHNKPIRGCFIKASAVWVGKFGGFLCGRPARVTSVGPNVRRRISAINPGLNFNPSFFFFCSKAFSRTIFSLLFRTSSHQIAGKKNKTEFASQAFIPEIKFRTNPGLTLNNPSQTCSCACTCTCRLMCVVSYDLWPVKTEVKTSQQATQPQTTKFMTYRCLRFNFPLSHLAFSFQRSNITEIFMMFTVFWVSQ